MAKKKYKLNQRLEIDWLDAHEDPDWLPYEDAIKKPREIYCKTVGYYLKEDDELIWLSASIGLNKRSARNRSVIPKGMIKKVRKLQIKRETKSKLS